MIRYAALRLLGMIPTLFAISLAIFLIVKLPPGDFLSNQMLELEAQGDAAAQARLAFYREEFGLDRSVLEQYAIWVGLWPGANGFSGLLQGDWGWSFAHDRPVAQVIGDAWALTIVLNAAVVLFIYLVAFPIGIYSATRPYSWGDYGFSLIGYLGLAVPNFLLGLVLLYYFNAWFGLSIGGLMDPTYQGAPWSWAKLWSVIAHLAVPVIVIGTAGTAAMIRRLRANLMDELARPAVLAAQARGIPGAKRLVKYPLRMALTPFIADIGNLLPALISGSVIVSVVLNLPTIGPVLIDALQTQDQYLAAFILLFTAVLTLAGMLLSDLLMAALDPRIRLTGRDAS